MARSFYRATPGQAISDFYHAASDTHYSMSAHAGKYYQRRWQIGPDGKETNAEEMSADYVMGSGNHAQTYLNRTPRGTLIELPLAWYSEKGGYWALNPGYDTAHPPSHRPIAYECMFCHNGYPQIPASHAEPGAEPVYGGTLPEGIDCQRCHGPGAEHVRVARSGKAGTAAIRAAIVNPARLTKERQMETCLQCHLETSSTRLPSLLRRLGKAPFSYTPGQPLGDFVISFDHAPGSGYDDKFEIAGSAYRFRQSQCFLKSGGEMTCTKCHDPHNIPRGSEAVAWYDSVCLRCHAPQVKRLISAGGHVAAVDCAGCHMPKRRTDDTVHAVITDHRIQRRKPNRDLLAELQESHPAPSQEYRGAVVPYYPAPLPPTPENALYVALAQVKDGRNLMEGIEMLTLALTKTPAARVEFYLALGDAWHSAGDPSKAADAYRHAAERAPGSARAERFLGVALHEAGQAERAAEALNRAVRLAPDDALAWAELGLVASDRGQSLEALRDLQKAVLLNPELPDAWNSLGVAQSSSGNAEDAERAFRESIRIDPYYAVAQSNLARLLAARGDRETAVFYFEKAARLKPSDGVNLYEYALTLVQMNRFEESQREVEVAVRVSPGLAEAHELLGGLLARNRNVDGSLAEFREAVRLKPEFGRAQLDLAATLATKGLRDEAVLHFREAAKSTEAGVAEAAASALRRMEGGK